ncbi:MAG: glycosyltransferase family 39 protein [Alphaproteobacteria bacterium]|jgi:4-amino-4-deoxy-L-arabinose transferase-like glycosyltransferase|nr:glycosyltransferase family 39 protein [Alphaproteobacteria bacterium]
MTTRRSAAAYDSSSPWSLALAHPRIVLVTLCLLMFVPGIASVPPLDRDESRFTQATKQMIETGDFIEIRFQDEARNKKPIGIYWMQAVTAGWLTGEPHNDIWAYRIPSVLAGIFAVLFVFGLGRKLFDEEVGLISAGILASSLLVIGESHIAKTDAVLFACVAAAQLLIAEFFLAARQGAPQPKVRYSALMGLAIGIGILVKGPMILFFVGLTVIAVSIWERRWGWIMSMRPIFALGIIILINVPWLVAIGLVTKGEYFTEAIGQDFLGKALSSQESHWGPPGYYLVSLLVGFWPGWLFLAPGIVYAIARSREGAVRFLLAWIIPAWIILELAPTKLPHYPLPVYPALALLCGAAVMAGVRESRSFLDNMPVKIGAVFWLMITIALTGGALFYLPGAYGDGDSVLLWALAIPVLGAAGIAVLFLLRGEGENASAAAIAAGAMFAAIVFAAVMPRLEQVTVSQRAAELIARSGALPQAVAIVGFHEPSIVFQVGTKITLAQSAVDAADFLTKTPNSVAMVESRMDAEFHQRLTQQNFVAEPIGNVKGLNYSNGRQVSLTLYRLRKTGP